MHRFASVVLVDDRGWVLLQERDEHARIDPETWGLVGGHVEDGEGFETAAYRELAEETGVVLAPGTLARWGEVQVFHEAYGTLDTLQLWYAAADLADADITVGEGRQIVFVDPGVIRRLRLSTGAAAVLGGFLDSAAYRAILVG